MPAGASHGPILVGLGRLPALLDSGGSREWNRAEETTKQFDDGVRASWAWARGIGVVFLRP